MVSWFLLRHCLYLAICWSIVVDVPEQIKFGCYWGSNANLQGPIEAPEGYSYLLEPFRNPEGLICQTYGVTKTFLSMLLLLQLLLVMWFWMIINVAYKVLRGLSAEDSRSDDEEEETEEEEADPSEKHPVEEEVGVEDLHLGGRKTNSNRVFKKSSSSSSGVSLPHDRKELLGRIGCDKPT
jgi:very-long-chain ceramide synthase